MKFQVSSSKFQVEKRVSPMVSALDSKIESLRKLGTWNLECGAAQKGFTLFELIVTLTVLAILIMGTIPLAQNAVKRQKEMRLRESLRMMRNAIDEFKRDTIGACPQGAIT